MTSFERYFDEDAQVVVNASLTGELWEEYYDENGALYYYERSSGATAWELPDNDGAAASPDEINALDADYPLYYEHAQDPGYPQYQEYAPDETYTQDQEYFQHQNYSQGQEYSLDQEYLQDQGLSPEQEYDQGQEHVRNSQLQSTTGVEGQDANEYAYQYDDPKAATAAAYYDSSAYDNLGADQAYDYTFDETTNYEEPNPPYADTDPDYNTVHPEATDIGDAGITSPMAFDETNATYYQTLGNDTSSEWTSSQEPQWVTYYDEESQLPYYVDLTTGQSAWELPPGTNPMPDADQLAWDTGDNQDLASPGQTRDDLVDALDATVAAATHEEAVSSGRNVDSLDHVAHAEDSIEGPEAKVQTADQELTISQVTSERIQGADTDDERIKTEKREGENILHDEQICSSDTAREVSLGMTTPSRIEASELEIPATPEELCAQAENSEARDIACTGGESPAKPVTLKPDSDEVSKAPVELSNFDSAKDLEESGANGSAKDLLQSMTKTATEPPSLTFSEGDSNDKPTRAQLNAPAARNPSAKDAQGPGANRIAKDLSQSMIKTESEPTSLTESANGSNDRLICAQANTTTAQSATLSRENEVLEVAARSTNEAQPKQQRQQHEEDMEADDLGAILSYEIHRETPDIEVPEIGDGVDESREEACSPVSRGRKQSVLQRRRTRMLTIHKKALAKALPQSPKEPFNRPRRTSILGVGISSNAQTAVFKLHSEYGSLSYGQMLGLLARDTLFRSKLAAASGSWRVKPTSLHHDFKEADKDKDGQLSLKELTRFCQLAARKARGNRRDLRPYEVRRRRLEQKGAVNSLESIKITVRIPFDCEQIIDPKLAETPYAHLSRQKEWDAESQKRTLAHNEKVMAFESKMRRRKTIETERRRVFDREKKHEEDRASRERKALRSKLHRRLHEDLREQCTQRLIELANDEVAAREEALRQMQENKSRKTLHAKSLRALSTARSLRVLAQPVQKPSAEEEIETISEMLSRNVAALNEDEKAQSKIAAFLAPSRQKSFEEWKVQQTASMEKRLEKKLNKHAGQMLRELQERAHRETERRAAFDSETDAAFAAHSEECEAYAAESVRLEYAEMKLRRLEQEAFQSIEKKRKQFLEISTSCFHRGPLRRLEWEETLKTFDKINRSVFKVRDERSGEAQILVRVPLGSTQAEAVKAREALERFRETGTHTLLSRAQRRDDRLPTFSRHLLRVHWTFVHHQRMHWELFILTEYCAGGRLSDVLARMYTSSTEASAIPEPILLRIAEQLTHALRALHLEGLAHLGLEPACIFFDAHNNLKVGIPRDVRSLQSQLGYQPRLAAATLRYAAPELMRIIVDASSAFDPAKADVWSLGAIMYHLATGAHLPSTSFAVAKLVAQPRVRQRRRWFRDLLRMTLQPRAADRATMTDVADFFSDVVDHVELEVSETFNRPLEPISTHAPEVREEVELGTFEASERDPNAASQSIIPAM